MAISGEASGTSRMHTTVTSKVKINLLQFAHLAQLLHPDLPFLLGRQQLHDGRLDHRDQRHVAVGGDRDRPEQFGRQLIAEEDGRRTIGAADDADTRRLARGEPEQKRPDESEKDAELRSAVRARSMRGLAISGTKISQGADTQKDQRREELQLDPLRNEIKESALSGSLVYLLGDLLDKRRDSRTS